MKRFVLATICMLMLAGGITAAYGDDIVFPSWERFTPDPNVAKTYQIWEFDTNDTTPAPDFVDNDYGTPELTVYPTGSWAPTWNGRDGVWPLSGTIEVSIPNYPSDEGKKIMWIQLTWAPETGTFLPGEPVLYISAKGTKGNSLSPSNIEISIVEEDPVEFEGSEPWHHTTYMVTITPNPAIETLTINGTIMVDELVIDTICTAQGAPEPTTLGLLATGSLGIILRQRRRK